MFGKIKLLKSYREDQNFNFLSQTSDLDPSTCSLLVSTTVSTFLLGGVFNVNKKLRTVFIPKHMNSLNK